MIGAKATAEQTMSAWGLARQEEALNALSVRSPKDVLFNYVDRVIRWIPADVLALFGFAVTALHTEHSRPSVALLVGFGAFTPLVVWAGVFALNRPYSRRDYAEIALSIPAFVIWSTTIPESGLWRWHTIAAHPVTAAIVAAACAIVFSLIAQGIEKRVDSKPVRTRSGRRIPPPEPD